MRPSRAQVRTGIGVGTAVALALAAAGEVAFAVSCDEPPDFVSFACAEPLEDTSGDGGADAGDGSGLLDAGAPVPLDGGDGGDGGPPTAYALARQVTANDCAIASVAWIQCDDGALARYYAIDGGQLTVDYFQMPSGALLGEVIFPTIGDNGVCTRGPSAFAPPACSGGQVVCCPYAPDAGDGGGDDGGDAGCGF